MLDIFAESWWLGSNNLLGMLDLLSILGLGNNLLSKLRGNNLLGLLVLSKLGLGNNLLRMLELLSKMLGWGNKLLLGHNLLWLLDCKLLSSHLNTFHFSCQCLL